VQLDDTFTGALIEYRSLESKVTYLIGYLIREYICSVVSYFSFTSYQCYYYRFYTCPKENK
jgi:hypothetical protein